MSIEPSSADERNAPRIQDRATAYAHCSIERCSQAPIVNLPLCEDHAWDVWAEMSARRADLAELAAAQDKRREWAALRNAELKAKLEANKAGTNKSEPGTIYYLQVERQVKIGFTTDLDVRLKAYPPMARLLATHPGTLQTEASVHARFRGYLAGRREWFHNTPELESHMQSVRTTFKQDHRVTA